VIPSPGAFEESKSYKAGPCRDDCRATQICLRNKAEERRPTSSKFNNHADFHIAKLSPSAAHNGLVAGSSPTADLDAQNNRP
jgi:hypothetical protein